MLSCLAIYWITPQNGQTLPLILMSNLIRDDGPCISQGHAEDVFKPGRRLDEYVKGSGLGLHIVNDIVEMYQGKIKILAKKSPGTHILLQLPGRLNNSTD